MNDEQKIPEIKLIPVEAVENPSFLPMRESVSDEKLKDLRESIKNHGLKYPILVRPTSDPDTFELKDGFLRLRCVRALGWKEVLAEVSETSDEEVVIESLITNKDRMDEDPITMAKKLDVLVNQFGWTQEKVAEELGMSREWVSNTIRFLKLPAEIQHSLSINNVSGLHALLLLTVDNEEQQLRLAREVVEHHLSTVELQHKIWDIKTMPHLHAVPIQNSGEGSSPLHTFTDQCSNPACLKMLYEEEIITVNQKPYCRSCAPEANIAYEKEKKKLEEVSIKSLDTAEVREARMHPQKSAFEERVVFRFKEWLGKMGLRLETDKKFCVLSTTPDAYVPEFEGLCYIDGAAVHSGNREDKDERLRELLQKHNPELNIQGFKYKADSKVEENRVFAAMCEWAEGLNEELGKWKTKENEEEKEEES